MLTAAATSHSGMKTLAALASPTAGGAPPIERPTRRQSARRMKPPAITLSVCIGNPLSSQPSRDLRWRRYNRPVRVPELPTRCAMLGETGEVAVLFDSAPGLVHADFMVVRAQHGKPRRKGIHSQAVAPPQLDVRDHPSELLDAPRRRVAGGEHQAA